METDIDKYYSENYHNEKQRTNFNINKQLLLDVQAICVELSRKSPKKVTASSEVRKMMVGFVITYGELLKEK